jgi:MFS family permease
MPTDLERRAESQVDSPYAWFRLAIAVTVATIGGVGLWSIVVALPAVQAEFGVARGGASLPYTLTMVGLVFGSIMMGRLSDRFGIVLPVVAGGVALGLGYVAASYASNLWAFAGIYGLVIGLIGSAAMFGPLIADTSLWFARRRGLAIALCASGNYIAGAVWPPIIEHFIATVGWRQTHVGIGLFCVVTIVPLALFLRRPPPPQKPGLAVTGGGDSVRALGLSPNLTQGLIVLAGLSCCVAMSMPQVHIVAYCVDLGYGPARGAEMLSLMLGFGALSRFVSGWVLDRIGGLRTLLLGSALQAVALAFYLPFDGLASLYVISIVFGLVQGGIVPSYPFIVRELFPAREAGFRVSLALSSTLAGMALGGWMSGAIFDATGSYQAALVNGIGWNLLNMAIAVWLLQRWRHRRLRLEVAAAAR